MLICTCPIDEDCIALGSQMDCFPWCEYLFDDELEYEIKAEWDRRIKDVETN